MIEILRSYLKSMLDRQENKDMLDRYWVEFERGNKVEQLLAK